VPMGISIWNAQNVTIADLSIGDVYYDPVEVKGDVGASAVTIYHVHLFNAGEQFIKVDPPSSGVGASNSAVEYSMIDYTNGAPVTDHGGGIGYTNAIDVHDGDNWLIAHNLIENIYTPDTDTSNLWGPAILIWNHSSDVTVDGNTIINCDRAIAMGLIDQSSGYDNTGGIVENNFIYQQPGLFSPTRTADSDGQVIVWDSPGTQVLNNTIMTSGNTLYSIQVRWSETGDVVEDNLSDTPISARDGATFTSSGNYLSATTSMFVDASTSNFHLIWNSATQANVINRVTALAAVPTDWDGSPRPTGSPTDIGASDFVFTSAAFIGEDTTTEGNWIGTYGMQGYDVINNAASIPSYATVTPSGQTSYTWAASTTDPRALQTAGGTGRIAACWYSSGSFTVDVNMTVGQTHDLELYFLDWDSTARAEQVTLTSAVTGAVLDTEAVSSFHSGVYLQWMVSGNVRITITKTAGANAVLSGLFFDPPSTSSAVFVKEDTTTEGNWIGNYGTQGYDVINNAASIPSYATVTPSGQTSYTWSTTTTLTPALEDAPGTGSGRIAACWYASTSFTVDVNITDGQTHDLALYFLDWDSTARAEQVTITSAVTGAVLNTQTVSSFHSGIYLKWSVRGNVLIRITKTAGANAVLSGLFFDPAT
jgi:hypothetical protein